MMNKKVMRSLLENMEREAEESLQRDSAFSEVLQVLKWEINNDPRVQSAIRDLEARGRRVFSSVVPRIRIRSPGFGCGRASRETDRGAETRSQRSDHEEPLSRGVRTHRK